VPISSSPTKKNLESFNFIGSPQKGGKISIESSSDEDFENEFEIGNEIENEDLFLIDEEDEYFDDFEDDSENQYSEAISRSWENIDSGKYKKTELLYTICRPK